MISPTTQTGAQPLVVFSHGNSFAASIYRVMLESLQARGFQVVAIDKYGHDPRYPVTNGWPHLVEQLAGFASAEIDLRPGVPVYLAGHSLGGFLSLMCAAQHPQLAGQRIAGVLLLDAPVLGGWKAAALNIAKKTGWVESFAPGAISRKRKNRWVNTEEAMAHFKSKKAFARWDEAVLHDYILHGTEDAAQNEPPQRLLAFDRDVETAIYNSLPHHLVQLLKRHPLQCPVAFIGGLESTEIGQVGLRLTRQVTQGRMLMINGTHLFPMEHPIAAAAAMEVGILSLAAAYKSG